MGYCYCRRYTIVFSWIVLAGLLFGFRTCTSAAAAASTSTATDESVHQDSTGTAGVAKSSTVVSTMAFEEWLSVHKSRTQKAQEQPQAGDSHRDYPHYATLEEFFFRHRIYEENLVRWNKLNEIPGGARYGPETEAHADCTIEEFARIVGSCYRERESGSNRTDESVSNSSGNRQSLQPPIQRRQQQQRNRNRLRPQSSKKSINAFTTHHLLEPFTIMDIDWREHAPPAVPPESSSSSKPISYVTPVKNQGPHGTCWSFGAAENLEGLAVQQGHPLQNISEQEFISCCDDCQGRSADHTFEWLLEATGGVPALEDTYPYIGNASVPCRAETAPRASVVLHSWGRVDDEDKTGDAIVSALREHGPMGLGVDAKCFHGYQSGVVRECGDDGETHNDGENSNVEDGGVRRPMVNHAVLMVAAGTNLYYDSRNDEHDATDPFAFPTSVEFYVIKNSWGPKWGEDGYVRIERGKDWWGEFSVIYTE